MVKQLSRKAGPFKKPTLVIFGWLAFFSSFLVLNPLWVVALLSVARVLPKLLSGLNTGIVLRKITRAATPRTVCAGLATLRFARQCRQR